MVGFAKRSGDRDRWGRWKVTILFGQSLQGRQHESNAEHVTNDDDSEKKNRNLLRFHLGPN